MNRWTFALACLALVTGSTAARAEDRWVVVGWGTPGSQQVAKNLARWKAEQRLFADVVTLAPGFPKAVKDPNLVADPSFHAVVLGLCKQDEAAVLLPLLKSQEPIVWTMALREKPKAASCPARRQGEKLADELGAQGKDGYALRATMIERTAPAAKAPVTAVHLQVRDWNDKHPTYKEITDHRELWFDAGCKVELGQEGFDGLAVRLEGRCPDSKVLVFRAVGGKLQDPVAGPLRAFPDRKKALLVPNQLRGH